MDNGQLLLAAVRSALTFDIGSYGIREWLAILGSLVGIGGSVYGAWRTYRYSKSQIANRLIEHLTDEEEVIRVARNHIIRRLRYGQPLPKEPDHAFFKTLKDVMGYLDRGEIRDAEGLLKSFADLLASSSKVGRKYISNVDLQAATVCLLVGKIAKDRGESTVAQAAWTSALQQYDQDAEAARYLGELALAGGAATDAWEFFTKAVDLAPDDKLLLAETSELKANFYRKRGNPRLELEARIRCASAFAEEGLHERAAVSYARAGAVASDLGQSVQAPRLLRHAFTSYNAYGDRKGMMTVREALENLGEDVSDLPSFEQSAKWSVRWDWIRLAMELALLLSAAYLFLITPR